MPQGLFVAHGKPPQVGEFDVISDIDSQVTR